MSSIAESIFFGALVFLLLAAIAFSFHFGNITRELKRIANALENKKYNGPDGVVHD